MKAILRAGVKVDFSFLTRLLKECWNNSETVGNACGVSFHSEVGGGRFLIFIQLQAST